MLPEQEECDRNAAQFFHDCVPLVRENSVVEAIQGFMRVVKDCCLVTRLGYLVLNSPIRTRHKYFFE